MNEDQLHALAERRRVEQFLAACHYPERWLSRAEQHRRAADILFEVAYAAYERGHERLLREFAVATPQTGSRTLEGQELEDHLDQSLLGVYLLLCGYALECILKGYLLATIPDLVVGNKRIDSLVAKHDLVQLSHDCGMELSDAERSLLRLLTRHIVWGKYTAPIKVGDMPSWIDPKDQEEKSLAVANPYAERRVQLLFNAVFDRATSRLVQEADRHTLARADDRT